MISWRCALGCGVAVAGALAVCAGLQIMQHRAKSGKGPANPDPTRMDPLAHPPAYPIVHPPEQPEMAPSGPSAGGESPELIRLREAMVEHQLRERGIEDERVLQAMLRVRRHAFLGESLATAAYDDCPQRIGHGQTISQPYIVALMTELARVKPESRVLDVGTGSGYQAAILGEICREVYSIEIVPELAEQAKRRLAELGYDHIVVRHGDGYRGWAEYAPFDAIIVAAAPDHVPPQLVEQLAVGGRLIIPVGNYAQDLQVVEKQPDGSSRQWNVAPVAFVPMTGEAQQRK